MAKSKTLIRLIGLLIFLLPLVAKAEMPIKPGDILNLEKCIEIATQRHPDIIAAFYKAEANTSKVGQARANYYPQLTGTYDYSRISSFGNSYPGGDLFSSIGGRGPFDQYSTGITLNQEIFNFGKTSTKVTIQKLNQESSQFDLKNIIEEIVFNVRQCYYELLKAKRNKEVGEEAVKQYQLHLKQAKGFYKVGTKPKFDVTKAEVDLSNSQLNLIKLKNALKIAQANLNNAMGIPEAPEYTIEDNLSFEKYEVSFEEALQKAYIHRPDLKSIIAQKKSAQASIALAQKGYYPELTGNAAYNWSGKDFPLERRWNAGVGISLPIFNGFLTKYQIDEAQANLLVYQNNEESLKQKIFLEVQQSFLNLKAAEEAIPTAELTVKQAEENLKIATGRYAAGVGNPIEVADAEVAFINAKTNYNQALCDYKVAIAALEKAIGLGGSKK